MPCTVLTPALGKNSLAVGSTSSGPSRGTETGTDGRIIYERLGLTDYTPEGYPWICAYPFLGAPSSSTEQADIDTVSWFSSYGPTKDNRIKPDVVAPGDQVRMNVLLYVCGCGGRTVLFVAIVKKGLYTCILWNHSSVTP